MVLEIIGYATNVKLKAEEKFATDSQIFLML